MKLVLQRAAYSIEGTFGILSQAGIPLCVTCEDPWLDNARNISCVPHGIYKVVKHNSVKYPNVWRLDNVLDRSGILIHAGNTENDTHGCILVGQSVGSLGDKPAVLSSKNALNYLRAILPDKFTLEIKE